MSAATGRAAWVGPSVAGFAAWAHTNPGPAIRELLGSKGGAVVSVPDAPSAASSGARLAFAPPAARPRGIAEDPVLEDRLPAGDRAKALPRWRAAQVDVELIDQAAASAIRLVVGWAAAQALAEVHENGALRPARTAATEWSEAQRDAPGAEASAAVASLARWVAADYGETRLRVARAVAAEKLPNPFAVVAAEPVVASADMSYAMAIDETVSQSMQTQRDLERSYLDVEADFAKLRESIAAQADQVVTRALTGALAVAIAALTAKQVRGWPVTIAGGVLALYVGGMAWYTLRPVRNEAKAQFEALRKIVAGRSALEPAGVEQLETQVNAWRTRINTHAIVAGAVLIALTLAALAGAWLGNEKISPLFPSKEAQKKTMRDRDTTARITPNFSPGLRQLNAGNIFRLRDRSRSRGRLAACLRRARRTHEFKGVPGKWKWRVFALV